MANVSIGDRVNVATANGRICGRLRDITATAYVIDDSRPDIAGRGQGLPASCSCFDNDPHTGQKKRGAHIAPAQVGDPLISPTWTIPVAADIKKNSNQ